MAGKKTKPRKATTTTTKTRAARTGKAKRPPNARTAKPKPSPNQEARGAAATHHATPVHHEVETPIEPAVLPTPLATYVF